MFSIKIFYQNVAFTDERDHSIKAFLRYWIFWESPRQKFHENIG